MSYTVPPYDTKTVREWVSFIKEFDLSWQTIDNGAVRMSLATLDIPSGTAYHYGLDVPEGREFIVYNRAIGLTEGDYLVEVVIPSDGFTGGTLSYKSTLRSGATPSVQTELYGGVTPSGTLTIVDQEYIDVGTEPGGNSRNAGAPAIEGVLVTITGKSILRVTPQSNGAYNSNIRLIAWERNSIAT